MPSAAEQEEVLDTGPTRRSRFLRVVPVLALVALIVALAVQSLTTRTSKPRASVPSSASPPPPPAVLGAPLEAAGRGASRTSDVVDIALGAGSLYIVRIGSFTVYDVGTGKVTTTVRVPELANFVQGPLYRAVVDAATDRVWLVRVGGITPADAIEFAAGTLARLGTVRLPGTVQAAAVLAGRVYLATADGVRELRSGTPRARLIPGTSGFVGYLAADPERQRLLVLNAGFPTRLAAMRPDGTESSVVSLPFGGAQVTVTHGVIWAAGIGTSGARIVRLEPATLESTRAASVAAMLGAEPLFVATGSRVMWVRDGVGGTDLWCLDAWTGAVSAHFPGLAGPVASQEGLAPATSRISYAFVAPQGVVRPLRLGGCSG
jgi:hypothetical protein